MLQAGPAGAISGSRWACRETFVSIIVSNLPIIQPLIRRLFNKIGLSSVLSSRSGPGTNSNNYELSSHALQSTNKDKKKTKLPYQPETLAWGSDEHILRPENDIGQSKDITIVSETVVQSEPWANEPGPASTSPERWGSPLPKN